MKQTKKGLTLTEHKQLGSELKVMRDRLTEMVADIGNGYPRTNNPSRLARMAVRRIDQMRSELDSCFSMEHPAEFDVNVYYGRRDDKETAT